MLQVFSISRLNATIVNIILRVVANGKKVEKKSDTIYPIFRCTDIADVIYITFNP